MHLKTKARRRLSGGAQADARGATQVLGRAGQAVAPGKCLSQVLDRGALARGAVPCAPQLLDRSAKAAVRSAAHCASHELDRGAQTGALTIVCGDATLSHQTNEVESVDVASVAHT
jgi:hypothetical protein